MTPFRLTSPAKPHGKPSSTKVLSPSSRSSVHVSASPKGASSMTPSRLTSPEKPHGKPSSTKVLFPSSSSSVHVSASPKGDARATSMTPSKVTSAAESKSNPKSTLVGKCHITLTCTSLITVCNVILNTGDVPQLTLTRRSVCKKHVPCNTFESYVYILAHLL